MIAFSRNQYRLSVLMFITINLLFYFKYLYRISMSVAIIGVLFYIVLSFYLFQKTKTISLSISRLKVLIGFIFFISILCIIGLYAIPRESLNVDRWEVIQVFWDSVCQGNNPYGAKNSVGNYPGPMPIYFLLYYPFYVIGEIGYSTLLLLVIGLFYFYKKYSLQTFFLIASLLFTSVFIFWEIVTRSTILINACLFCYFFLFILKIRPSSPKQFYFSALIGGLIFSIRNVFILPMIIWGIYMLHSQALKWFQLLKWGIVFIFSFGITFIPFLFLWFKEFLVMNPFLIQSSVLIPFQFILGFMVLAIGLGFMAKNETDVFFYSCTILFLMIITHIGYWIFREGFMEGYLNSRGDISYFLFSVPFLLEIIAQRKQIDHDKK